MQRRRCILCQRRYGEENVSFFSVPKLQHQRQRWIEQTGIHFKPSAVVCQDHFTMKDFINGPGESLRVTTRVRLQPGAVPSLNIPSEMRSQQAAEAILPDQSAYESDMEVTDPTCHICNKSCPKGKIGLYPPPRDSTIHARWNAACGMLLKEWARICERHFQEDDFQHSGKRKRLNPNAIPSLFLLSNRSTRVAETTTNTMANVDSIVEELIDIKPFGCDVEDINFTEYLVDTDTGCYSNFVSKSVQTSFTDSQTCAFIQVQKDKKIYNVHCFYCDQIFTIWNWPKFIKHIEEEHKNEEDDQESFLSPAESSQNLSTKRRHSPIMEVIKIEPEFFAVNTMEAEELEKEEEEELLAELSENAEFEEIAPKQSDNEEFDEVAPRPKRQKKVLEEKVQTTPTDKTTIKSEKCDSSSGDEDSDDGLSDSMIAEEAKGSKSTVDNTRKMPMPCNQIYYTNTNSATIFGFLELWKLYPVLWQKRETPNCPAYNAALTELTIKVNANLNLNVTAAGLNASLIRFRKWYQDRGYKRRGQHKFKKYYIKCSEFLLSPQIRSSVRCGQCAQLFTSKEKLREHEVSRHNRYCAVCQKEFRTASRYRKHAAVKHDPPRFTCNICGQKYSNDQCFREHMRAHRNERNFVCDECGVSYVRQRNLREHKLKKHPNSVGMGQAKRPPCAICGIDFNDYTQLSNHRRKFHMVLEGTIEELVRGVPVIKKLREGPVRGKRVLTWIIDPVTQTRRVVCDFCDNNYARVTGLSRHQVKEHGYIPPGELLKAAQQKLNEKEVETEISSNCDQEAESSEVETDYNAEEITLNYENFDDDDESDFDEVNEFRQDDRLIRGKRVHTWITDPQTKMRRVVCDLCDKNYAHSSALSRHQEKQHGYVRPSVHLNAIRHSRFIKKVVKTKKYKKSEQKQMSEDAEKYQSESDAEESSPNCENDNYDDISKEDEDEHEIEALDSDFDEWYLENEEMDVC